MTAPGRPLAALAALFVPDRAGALLARLSDPRGAAEVEEAARLCGAPRRERLAALAAGLAPRTGAIRQSAEAAAALERPRVAAVLRAMGGGSPPARASALLIRLCRERIGR